MLPARHRGLLDKTLWDIVHASEQALACQFDFAETADRVLTETADKLRALIQTLDTETAPHTLAGRQDGYLPARHPGYRPAVPSSNVVSFSVAEPLRSESQTADFVEDL